MNDTATFELVYLGIEERKNKKTGNPYYLAKFANSGGNALSFYIGDPGVKEAVRQLIQFQVCTVMLKLGAYNGEPKLELIDVQQKGVKAS